MEMVTGDEAEGETQRKENSRETKTRGTQRKEPNNDIKTNGIIDCVSTMADAITETKQGTMEIKADLAEQRHCLTEVAAQLEKAEREGQEIIRNMKAQI